MTPLALLVLFAAAPDIPEAPGAAPVVTPDATATDVSTAPPGTLGGLAGAASGCGAGMGAPAAVLGAGGGFLYWLYGQAALGACVGWTPALLALGTSTSMCGAAVCLPIAGSAAATAGAMYGARSEGRDPVPALLGALPGLGTALVATGFGVTALVIGMGGGFAAAAPLVIVGGIGIVLGVAAPPCTACGAAIGDMAYGKPAPGVAIDTRGDDEETARAAPASTMKF